MAIAKLILNGVTQMDVTGKTVTSSSMLSGATALKNDGTDITGNIASKSSSDLTASGATVTAPAGYYGSDATKTISSGTEGTPTATKGTVSNHSVSVTPSVTNTAGYISGGTHAGTAVTVAASELVSGTKSISANGTSIDVTNYAAVDVAVPAPSYSVQTKSVEYTPSTSQQTDIVTPSSGYDGLDKVNITINAMPTGTVTAPSSISGTAATVSTGTNTLTLTKTIGVTPNVTTMGYIASGTTGNSNVSLTANVTTKAAATIHPSTSQQSIASGTYLTGAQTISAVTTTNLAASNIISGVTIKVGDSSDDDCVASVTGNVVLQSYYTGSSAPTSGTGSDGDLYLQTT